MTADVRARLFALYVVLGSLGVAAVFAGAFGAVRVLGDGVRVETRYEPAPLIGPALSYGDLRERFGDPSQVTTCGEGLPGLVWTDGRSWQLVLCSPEIRG